MAFKKQEVVEQVAAHSHEDLEKKVAALEKEVAELKKELVKSKGGNDPRIDLIIQVLKTNAPFEHKFKKLGII